MALTYEVLYLSAAALGCVDVQNLPNEDLPIHLMLEEPS